MATFIENAIDSQDPRTDNHISIPTAKIEEGILKQLFYKVNYKRIPQSRYRKLHKIRTFGIGLWMVIAIAIACVLLFVFWPEKFATAVDKVFVAGEKLCLSKNWTIALFGCFAVGCIGLFSYVFRFLLSKIKIKETKIPGVETTIETEGEKNSSVFDKHLDEIVYFFEETKYKVVFFEDLDRLEDAVYDEVMGSDDYAEIIQLFGERVAEQAAKTREMFNDLRLEGQDVSPLTIKDCTPITGDDDLHNKVIVIKPDKLRREYQKANYQLKLCTGGFGASPKSRGNACFCVDLFSGQKSRFERYEVMGTLKEEQLPKWARDGLEAYWHKKQHEQRLQGKPKKVEMER